MEITAQNFYLSTMANFIPVSKIPSKFDFTSLSGSKYIYTTDGVFRYSNHWGKVKECNWTIDGKRFFHKRKFLLGFCKWKDFIQVPVHNT